MHSTPPHSRTDDTPEDFDQVLRELAHPSDVAPGVKARLAHGHELSAAVEQALRDASSSHEPRPGDVLEGRYRVLRVLGRGGMGVILEAEQLRTRKLVAIKWMSAARGEEKSPGRVERFLREARAVANIQDPNVVQLYDVGDSDGVPFLVLERLHGESLRARLARGAMALDEVASVLRGVLSGVAAVHRAGIVHRDLKPDNIFLCRPIGEDAQYAASPPTAKVLDFGVAAMRVTTQDGLASLTRTGALLGTPAYMALEQLTGGSVDARADIYALGALSYEMLTGRLPFEARSAPELAVLLATQEPTPPSKYAPTLPRALEAVILRALSRKADARYQDVAAFAQAWSESVRAPQRGRVGVARGVSLVVAIALAVVGARYATQHAPSVDHTASAARELPMREEAAVFVTPPAGPDGAAPSSARQPSADSERLPPGSGPPTPDASSTAAPHRASRAPRERRVPVLERAVKRAAALPTKARPAVPAPPATHDETAISLDDF